MDEDGDQGEGWGWGEPNIQLSYGGEEGRTTLQGGRTGPAKSRIFSRCYKSYFVKKIKKTFCASVIYQLN